MTITTADEMIRKVEQEYAQYDSELTCMFFDFDVDMPVADILFAYGQIQKDINDDYVWINSDVLRDTTRRYKGNCMEFLESLNGQEDYYVRYSEGEINSCFVF